MVSILLIFLYIFVNQVDGNCYSLSDKNIELQTPKSEYHCIGGEPRNNEDTIFNEDEEVPPKGEIVYLTKAIKHLTLKSDQLLKLNALLGRKTAALSLAAASLENKKIEIEDYIDRIGDRKVESDLEFNKNEVYINKAMSVAIEILKTQEGDIGKLAFDILLIRSFMGVCHLNVKMDFYSSVTNSSISDVKSATDLLQTYGLIIKLIINDREVLPENREQIVTLVNPIFLPLIRYNGRHEKEGTLRRILESSGFQAHKYAAAEFADGNLLNEYPIVKSVTIDHPRLLNLVNEGRYVEASQLAKEIHSVVRTKESLYNYGKVLGYSGNTTEAILIFQCLHGHLKVNNYTENKLLLRPERYAYSDKGIIDIRYRELSGPVVTGNLLVLLWNNGNIDEVKEMLINETEFFIPSASIQSTMRILELISDKMYLLVGNFNVPEAFHRLEVRNSGHNAVNLVQPYLNSSLTFPSNLQYLAMSRPKFFDQYGNKFSEFDVSNSMLIGTNLSEFILSDDPYGDSKKVSCSKLKVSPHLLSSVSEIKLIGLTVNAQTGNKAKMQPRRLLLRNVTFGHALSTSKTIFVNDFVAFSRIEQLQIFENSQKELKIDLSSPVTIEHLNLDGIEIQNWKNASWTIENLYLKNIANLETATPLKSRKVHLTQTTISLSALPSNVEELTLQGDAKVIDGPQITLPKLNTLTFNGFVKTDLMSMSLPMFSQCPNITTLRFRYEYCQSGLANKTTLLEIKSSDIPKNVMKIESFCNIKILGEDLYLEKLILQQPVRNWGDVDTKLKINHNFVVDTDIRKYDITSDSFYQDLTNLQERFKVLTIGMFAWHRYDFENSTFSKLVDKKSEWYTFENSKGAATELNWERDT